MPADAKILIVDDEPFNVDLLEQQLDDQGYETCAAYDGREALKLLESEKPDLVLLDWMMPGMNGIEVLEIMRNTPEWVKVPVIMVTARGSIEDKVVGLNAGADDYVTKPIDEAELQARIRAMLRIATLEQENSSLRQEIAAQPKYANVIGKSKAMESVFLLLGKVVDSQTTVLLSGETGTGKELVARTIHTEGQRHDRPFIAVNCGAMAEQLLESELFGHKKGAFTGAVNDRPGLFEAADGGTLFLDEIGETSPALQVRLLRAIQEGEIRRVGEEQDRKVDVRVIAATHRDLQSDVAAGKFREDLYYRLSVFPIDLPPLRQRREDIADLAVLKLNQLKKDDGGLEGFTARAMDALSTYEWPGNIRELQNEVERAALLCDENRIDVQHLSERISGQMGQIERQGKLKDVVAQVERQMITEALKRHNSNRTHTATDLGVSRWGLVQKIKIYEIEE
jgi:DNA-binding NtrC family response regulator